MKVATPCRLLAAILGLLAYLPGRTTVSVQLDKLAASEAEAFWIDPITGTRTRIGRHAAEGRRSFATPAGCEDAVLLIAQPATAEEPAQAAASTGTTSSPAWLKEIPTASSTRRTGSTTGNSSWSTPTDPIP